jgi:hypothetical protein
MEQVANAKRTMEESVQESKRQQLNLPRQPSFSCLLDNVLASIHEFQLELGSLTLIPETPQQALDILEPLIWSSARLDFGITLSYFGAVHKVSSFGIDSHLTVDNWERIPRDILQVRSTFGPEPVALTPLQRQFHSDAADRIGRISKLLSLYCQPLASFTGTSQRFVHAGLLPALNTIQSLVLCLEEYLSQVLESVNYCPATKVLSNYLPFLHALDNNDQLRFSCVVCRICPIFLPTEADRTLCGHCHCRSSAHSTVPPFDVNDLLEDDY